ncbi:MAG: cell division protein ZipA C-terminal FtsZ-binding domain-containing protein [Pseudomonadota bacterium]
MTELRWALLALGVVFVAALAWWEYRRPRLARREEPTLDTEEPPVRQLASRDFEIPDMRTSEVVRDSPLPVIHESMLTDSSMDLKVAREVAVDTPGSGAGPATVQPTLMETEAADSHKTNDAARALKLDWPPAEQQRIVSLRVVPQPPARFSGRALRQALNACGMEHGPQQIFHWAREDGRVIVSAANLTRPGSFDPATMDTLYYHGLSLFSVLPGPLAPENAVDELVALARDLAGRLAGLVQDELGRPLDAARIAAIRSSVAADSAIDGADA